MALFDDMDQEGTMDTMPDDGNEEFGGSYPQEQPQQLTFADQTETHIAGLYNSIHIYEQLLSTHRDTIRALANQYNQDKAQQLHDHLSQVLSDIQTQIKLLHQVNSFYTLRATQLHQVREIESRLVLCLNQVELFLLEVQCMTRPDAPGLARMVIIRQPFPLVIRQTTSIANTDLVVKFVTGATVSITQMSSVTATLHGTRVPENPLAKNVVPVDMSTMTASFGLQFTEGTRKSLAHITFKAQVELAQLGSPPQTVVVDSQPTAPLVVMTNQKQWEDCEKLLVEHVAFQSQPEIMWSQFTNVLQRHCLTATKQEWHNPTRELSVYDFTYLHAKFFGCRPSIHQREFEQFWAWYGKSMQAIRYQRHIGKLWMEGLLYGFMSREDVSVALAHQPQGVFVIRFSERHAGQFAIAYVHAPDQLRHYLVKPTDTAGAKITLPDFINDVPQFGNLLKFDVQSPHPQFHRLTKQDALQAYVANKQLPGEQGGSGYHSLNG